MIEWFGFGAGGYSHCASVLADGRYLDSRTDVLGGVPPGVHLRHPADYAWVRKRRLSLSVTQDQYDAWEANLRAKVGDAYAVSDIFGFVVGRNFHRSTQYFCSALAVNAVQHISRSWQLGHLGFVPFPLPFSAHQLNPNVALLILATAGFTVGPEIENA